MTEYALSPNSKWDVANSPYRTPRVMLEADQLQAYRVRGNGTMRHLDLFPLGGTKRETAEWISDAIEYDGRSVESVAREMHVSTATVRRFIEGLELTEEIEAGDWDGLSFDSTGQPVWDTACTELEDEKEEELCNCAAQALGNNWHTPGCPLAPAQDTAADLVSDALKIITGQGDQVSEEPKPAPAPRTRRTRTRSPKPIEDVVKSQGLPWPTDEERAAALAEVTANLRAAGAPEPERSAEAALADPKVERRVVSRQTTAPAQGAALAVCFCGSQGQHAPGSENCVNRSVPRRTRSHG